MRDLAGTSLFCGQLGSVVCQRCLCELTKRVLSVMHGARQQANRCMDLLDLGHQHKPAFTSGQARRQMPAIQINLTCTACGHISMHGYDRCTKMTNWVQCSFTLQN